MLHKTRCKTGRTSKKVCATKSRRNFSQRTHSIHPIGPKTNVLMCFVLFGCMRGCLLAYETRCETGRTSAKVSATKSRRNFSQRTLRKTRIGPKLTFWCVSYYFGAFRNVWLRYETRCKTSRTSAKLRATKSRQNFSQQTHPNHPIRP